MSLTKDGFYKQIGGVKGNNDYLLQAGGGAKAWGNASGNIPVSNGTVNTNLNADLLDGKHLNELFTQFANVENQTTRITIGGETKNLQIDADKLDGYHASNLAKVNSYTLLSNKGVRITYPSHTPIIVSVCGTNSGAQLIIIGTGYGEGGRVRNQFTELVSCSLFDWSIPNSNDISRSVEVFSRRDGDSTVKVISTDGVSFTSIDALTSAKENATLLTSSNYTNYTVTKSGGGASGTWGINITGNAGNADTVDGIHASGLFTQFADAGNQTTRITIGGTTKELNIDADKLDGVHLNGIFTAFSGGGISSSGNTISQANHSITIGGVTKTAGSSSANIINSLSVSKLTSNSTTNLTIGVTVNGVASADKTLTDLYARDADKLDGKHLNELFTQFANAGNQTTRITIGGETKNLQIDADTLDGYHANGLFTKFENSGNDITATIGGVSKTFTVNYASNADKIDGYHAGVQNGQVSIFVPWPSISTLKSEGFINSNYGASGYGHPTEEYLQAICKWAINHYSNQGDVTLIGSIAPNSSGTIIMHLYSSSGKDSTTLLPRYCASLYQTLGGQVYEFGCVDYVWYYRGIGAGNADTLDGIHASGLFTQFADAGNQTTRITIGGTTKELNIDADKLDGVHLNGIFTAFSGGGISSSGNTISQANHSITIGGVTKTAGSSSANIINSLSVSTLTSNSTTNLTVGITVNGVVSANKTLTDLYARDADKLDGKHINELFTQFANVENQTTRITIGGVTKNLQIDADKLDGYHADDLRIEIIDLRKYA